MNQVIFMFFMILGVLISIMSSSWVGMWMGMELNMIMFIPFMFSFGNLMVLDSIVKYFLIQVMGSLLFIVFFMMNMLSNYMFEFIMFFALILKLGIAPFHFWLAEFMDGLTWMSNFVFMTLQKIPFFMLMFYLLMNIMKYELVLVPVLSVVVGAFGGFNQMSLRKLMAYSSISHMGWMLISMMSNGLYIFIYYYFFYMLLMFIICSILDIFQVFSVNDYFYLKLSKNMKLMFMLMLLSLGGLPPLLGFLMKWMVLQGMMMNNMFMLMMIMMLMVLLTLYYYLRLSYMMMMNSDLMVFLMNKEEYNYIKGCNFIHLINIFSILLLSMLINY